MCTVFPPLLRGGRVTWGETECLEKGFVYLRSRAPLRDDAQDAVSSSTKDVVGGVAKRCCPPGDQPKDFPCHWEARLGRPMICQPPPSGVSREEYALQEGDVNAEGKVSTDSRVNNFRAFAERGQW